MLILRIDYAIYTYSTSTPLIYLSIEVITMNRPLPFSSHLFFMEGYFPPFLGHRSFQETLEDNHKRQNSCGGKRQIGMLIHFSTRFLAPSHADV